MNIVLVTFKKNKYIFITLGILLCIAIYYFGIYNSTSVIKLPSAYINYENLYNFDKAADAIVIGSTNDEFNYREHFNKYFEDGTLEDFYSLTEIKIHKILKEDDNLKNGNIIKIIEPASMIQTATGKQILTDEDYSPIEKNKKYILFLKKNDKGQYCIINMNLGKIDLSLNQKNLDKNTKENKFIKDIFDKYQTE